MKHILAIGTNLLEIPTEPFFANWEKVTEISIHINIYKKYQYINQICRYPGWTFMLRPCD